MKRYELTDIIPYNNYKAVIKTGGFAYAFTKDEELPTIPERPTVTDLQVADLEYSEQDGNLVATWNVRDKTEDELNAELSEQVEEVDVNEVLRVIVEEMPEDKQVQFKGVYKPFKIGEAVKAGDKRLFDGKLWKAIQAHTTQRDWLPNTVPALWVQVGKDAEILDWKQPTGAHDAYNTGDRVRFNNRIYESTRDANVWSPAALPTAWEEVKE